MKNYTIIALAALASTACVQTAALSGRIQESESNTFDTPDTELEDSGAPSLDDEPADGGAHEPAEIVDAGNFEDIDLGDAGVPADAGGNIDGLPVMEGQSLILDAQPLEQGKLLEVWPVRVNAVTDKNLLGQTFFAVQDAAGGDNGGMLVRTTEDIDVVPGDCLHVQASFVDSPYRYADATLVERVECGDEQNAPAVDFAMSFMTTPVPSLDGRMVTSGEGPYAVALVNSNTITIRVAETGAVFSLQATTDTAQVGDLVTFEGAYASRFTRDINQPTLGANPIVLVTSLQVQD